MDVGGGDAQVVEEDVGEHGVVMLSGVDDHMFDASLPEGRVDGGQLDELGPGAHD